MTIKEDYELLMTMEHVIGARLVVIELREKGFDVRLDEIPTENDAKVWVKKGQQKGALIAWELFKEEVQLKIRP